MPSRQGMIIQGKLRTESIDVIKDYFEKQKKQKKREEVISLQKKPLEMELKKHEITRIEMPRPKLVRIQVHPQLTY